MQFIIARSTVASSAVLMDKVIASYEPEWAGLTPAGEQGFVPCFEGKNQSVRYDSVSDTYVICVNDAMILRVMGLYLKVANVVSPLIKHLVKLAELFKPKALDLVNTLKADIAGIEHDLMADIVPVDGYVVEQDDEPLDIRESEQGDPVLAN